MLAKYPGTANTTLTTLSADHGTIHTSRTIHYEQELPTRGHWRHHSLGELGVQAQHHRRVAHQSAWKRWERVKMITHTFLHVIHKTCVRMKVMERNNHSLIPTYQAWQRPVLPPPQQWAGGHLGNKSTAQHPCQTCVLQPAWPAVHQIVAYYKQYVKCVIF